MASSIGGATIRYFDLCSNLVVHVYYRSEVVVKHGLPRCDSFSLNMPYTVINQTLVQKVECFLANQMLILVGDEVTPSFFRRSDQPVLVLVVQIQTILLHITHQFVSAHDLDDLDQLVVVVIAMEEWLLLEDLYFSYHGRQHSPQTPDVKRVVVQLVVHQQLWALVVARGHSHVVLTTWEVELRQAPIDHAEFALGMVDHYVVGLDISMDYALRVAEI